MNDAAAGSRILGLLFRAALFAAAASLALYIPYKYATQLHAVNGLYAFLFPLSSLLALAGMVLAVRPAKACDCSATLRSGLAALSLLWLATGAMCAGTLTRAVLDDPLHGSIATLHMLLQHVFLSAALLAFASRPARVVTALRPASRHAARPGTPAAERVREPRRTRDGDRHDRQDVPQFERR